MHQFAWETCRQLGCEVVCHCGLIPMIVTCWSDRNVAAWLCTSVPMCSLILPASSPSAPTQSTAEESHRWRSGWTQEWYVLNGDCYLTLSGVCLLGQLECIDDIWDMQHMLLTLSDSHWLFINIWLIDLVLPGDISTKSHTFDKAQALWYRKSCGMSVKCNNVPLVVAINHLSLLVFP